MTGASLGHLSVFFLTNFIFKKIVELGFSDNLISLLLCFNTFEKNVSSDAYLSMEVPHEGSCKVICYMEPNCVSINVRPATQGGNFICELNNATGGNKSSSALQSKEGHIYVAIEVLRTDFIWPKIFF